MKDHNAPYVTLGDIADELRRMKADGMTRSSVEYALGRVYWETPTDQAEARS